MMESIEGVVVRVDSKMRNTRNGPAESFSALVNVEGDERWFGYGFKRPPFSAGQAVKFVAKGRDWNGQTYWDFDPNTVEVSKATVAAKASPKVAKAVKSDNHKDRMIVQQTAYKVAADIVSGAVASAALPLPKTPKGKAWEVYLEYVHETAGDLAARFIDPPEVFGQSDEVDASDMSEEDAFAPATADEEYAPV